MTDFMPDFLVDGSSQARHQLILAHGAGADAQHPFMTSIAKRIASDDIQVIRFNFPYMQLAKQLNKRRPPDRMPKLLDAYRQVLTERLAKKASQSPAIWLGGKSMGGRVASLLAQDEVVAKQIQGVIMLGFPFHPPAKADKFRGEHLQNVLCPHLILQGERDKFGDRQEVERYSLDEQVKVSFVANGDHSFIPLKRSGITMDENMSFASRAIINFILDRAD